METRKQAEANNHPEPVTIIDPCMRFNDFAFPPCGQEFQIFDLSDVCVASVPSTCVHLATGTDTKVKHA
jgi:hypothetical protein